MNFKPGDTVKVFVKIKEQDKERLQPFEGTVIAISSRGKAKAFTVRKISSGIGVERVFLSDSPNLAKVEVLKSGKVRRAKLYYLKNLRGKSAKIEELK